MKIITNTDIKNLIIFARKEMGIYKLVYKEYKKIYFSILFLVLLLILFFFIFLFYYFVKHQIISIIVGIEIILAVTSFRLMYLLVMKTKVLHQEIQENRFRILEDYYKDKNYKSKDIIIINNQLQQRIDNIKSNNVKISVILVALIFPIWELYVSKLGEKVSLLETIMMLIPRTFFISICAIILFPIYNFVHKLMVETFSVLNNVYVINNIIYLNGYIIDKFSRMEE